MKKNISKIMLTFICILIFGTNNSQPNKIKAKLTNQAENLDSYRFLCAESDRHIYFCPLTLKNRQN